MKLTTTLLSLLLAVNLFAGNPHPRYSGSHHTTSHGGHYSGGSGSSHKGGHYVNPKTNNTYGRHRK